MPNSMDYNPTSLIQQSTATTRETNLINQTLDHHPYDSTQHQHGNIHTTPSPDLDPAPAPSPATAPAPAPAPAPPTMQRQPWPPSTSNRTPLRYQECLKNHAASTGGNVLDGCCEFMPDGDENTPEALKCAACGCHRNFHRKLTYSGSITQSAVGHSTASATLAVGTDTNKIIHTTTPHHLQPVSFPSIHAQPLTFAQPSRGPVMMAFGGGGEGPAESSRSSEDLHMFNSNAEGQLHIDQHNLSASRKRFRTKFSHQQKQKMSEFAETVGWSIQKQDEQEVKRFCDEVGVKRQVFKVWMHNNKQAMKKKQM